MPANRANAAQSKRYLTNVCRWQRMQLLLIGHIALHCVLVDIAFAIAILKKCIYDPANPSKKPVGVKD
ncbi:unnamed protein product [Sphenostylis stenocarpa]|uniref:Uncharacterized protein n=1 Tax=Sphenostylis stenocarpa TaxID=92480 RepID=A0AA86SWH5_9FABA|nr:unnamed protein product [Sphenostylis stenocarpa]